MLQKAKHKSIPTAAHFECIDLLRFAAFFIGVEKRIVHRIISILPRHLLLLFNRSAKFPEDNIVGKFAFHSAKLALSNLVSDRF